MIKNLSLWFAISLTTIVISITILVTVQPLWGTDFTGGSLLEFKALSATNSAELQTVLQQDFSLTSTIQTTQDNSVLIRTTPLSEQQHQDIVKKLNEQKKVGEELRFEFIGPTIGQELRRKAVYAVVLATIGIILYLTYAFRRTVGLISPWKFGVAATFALIHDLLFVSALFAILGKVYGVTVDSLFVTAMLSVMGYSVNDTIVIFDRLREEWLKARGENLAEIMRRSVRLSIIRSLNTSITILLVLLAMFLLGGSSIRWFIVALIAGTIVGTYSSIYVATPALYWLSTRGRKK